MMLSGYRRESHDWVTVTPRNLVISGHAISNHSIKQLMWCTILICFSVSHVWQVFTALQTCERFFDTPRLRPPQTFGIVAARYTFANGIIP